MTTAARLFTEAARREAMQAEERRARQEAILRKYDRHPASDPRVWEIALRNLAALLWIATLMLASAGVIATLQS